MDDKKKQLINELLELSDEQIDELIALLDSADKTEKHIDI